MQRDDQVTSIGLGAMGFGMAASLVRAGVDVRREAAGPTEAFTGARIARGEDRGEPE